MSLTQRVVLCEGYSDRAFWKGWLTHLGCAQRREDPMGRSVGRGAFGYQTPSGAFVMVVPCGDRPSVLPEARRRLKERDLEPLLTHLVLNVDRDLDVEQPGAATGLRAEDVEREVLLIAPTAGRSPDGGMTLDDGRTTVSLVVWEAPDRGAPGIPRKQTLERLACASIASAYPQRPHAVETWLRTRPEAPPADHRSYAWSYMAGWHARDGCDRFFAAIWEDAAVRAQLELRLKEAGSWRIAQAMAV